MAVNHGDRTCEAVLSAQGYSGRLVGVLLCHVYSQFAQMYAKRLVGSTPPPVCVRKLHFVPKLAAMYCIPCDSRGAGWWSAV